MSSEAQKLEQPIGNPPEVDEAAIEQAWIEEVRRRVEARRREPTELIPWSTVRDELRNR